MTMKDRLFLKIRPYLPQSDRPYVLGLSGGPDSMALFHLMAKMELNFHVVTIDHGWRNESKQEVIDLEQLAKSYQVPFASFALDQFDYSRGNVEDRLRDERHAILTRYLEKVKGKALVLGHHLNDQAETILKRIFEGARLTHLYGIHPTPGKIIRPFIEVEKKEILTWLKENQIDYFYDKTNEDERYLRARMRKKMIPELEETFGKKLSQNLGVLAARAVELNDYLDKKVAPYLVKAKDERIDPSNLEVVELKHLICSIANLHHVTLNRSQVDTIIGMVLKGEGNKHVVSGHITWCYHNRMLQYACDLSDNSKSCVDDRHTD